MSRVKKIISHNLVNWIITHETEGFFLDFEVKFMNLTILTINAGDNKELKFSDALRVVVGEPPNMAARKRGINHRAHVN